MIRVFRAWRLLLQGNAAIMPTQPVDVTEGEITVTVSFIIDTRVYKVITSMPLTNALEIHADLKRGATTTSSQMLIGVLEAHPLFPRGDVS